MSVVVDKFSSQCVIRAASGFAFLMVEGLFEFESDGFFFLFLFLQLLLIFDQGVFSGRAVLQVHHYALAVLFESGVGVEIVGL